MKRRNGCTLYSVHARNFLLSWYIWRCYEVATAIHHTNKHPDIAHLNHPHISLLWRSTCTIHFLAQVIVAQASRTLRTAFTSDEQQQYQPWTVQTTRSASDPPEKTMKRTRNRRRWILCMRTNISFSVFDNIERAEMLLSNVPHENRCVHHHTAYIYSLLYVRGELAVENIILYKEI